MPKGKNDKLVYNFFSLGIVQVITSLLQLIVIPYVISKIGIDGFGKVSVAQVLMFYLSALTEYGFNQTATREISLHRADSRLISVIFYRVLFSKIILCILSFVILLLLIMTIPFIRVQALLYLAGFCFVIGQAVLINWFLQGVEKMQWIAVTALLARCVFVALVFLFIKSKNDHILYLFFLGAGNFLMGIACIFIVINRFRLQFSRPALKDILREFSSGWQITASNLLNNFCQYANVFILRLFTNDLVTGYYSIAERVFLTLRQLPGVFSQSVYPQVCQVMEKGKQSIISYFRRVYIPFLLGVAGGCLLLFVLSPQVLRFFIVHSELSPVGLLRVFAIVLLVACLNIPATLILLAADRRGTYFRIYTTGAIVNVILNIILAFYFGSAGTVTAILATELLIMITLTRALFRLNLVANEGIPGTGGAI